MTPYPKPSKQEKVKMTAREFREKYAGKKITTKPKRPSKKFPSPQERFYKSTAWKWFARYIKLRDCDKQGIVRCATSGVLMSVSDKNLHAGHLVKVFESNSSKMAVAFDERNVLPQSMQENRFYSGRPDVMRDKVNQKFGEGTYEDLVLKSKQWKKYSDSELQEIAKSYRIKAYDLLKELGLKKWWK